MSILEHRSKKGLIIRLAIIAVLFIIIVIVLLCNRDSSGEEMPDKGAATVAPTITSSITPTVKPTPKPTVVYPKPTGSGGSINIDVTMAPSKTPTPEPTRAPNDFDSSDYVTYNPDGSIIFDFDSYTEDALGKKSE